MNPTSKQAAPQCRGAAVTRQQGPTCRVAGRDREKAMDATQRTHNRRNAKRRVQKRLAKLRKENTPPPPGVASRPGTRCARALNSNSSRPVRKENTPPPPGVASRPGTRCARALNSNSSRPVPPVPASVDNSTRAQDGGSTRCCRLCDARFVVTSRAVRYFDKQGWQPRACCYKCTTAKKQIAAAAARAVAEQLKQERRPRSRSDDPVPPAVEGDTRQTAGAPAPADNNTQQAAGAPARADFHTRPLRCNEPRGALLR